jgi:hypothetical protein
MASERMRVLFVSVKDVPKYCVKETDAEPQFSETKEAVISLSVHEFATTAPTRRNKFTSVNTFPLLLVEHMKDLCSIFFLANSKDEEPLPLYAGHPPFFFYL